MLQKNAILSFDTMFKKKIAAFFIWKTKVSTLSTTIAANLGIAMQFQFFKSKNLSYLQ